jgi:hypothetical protein
MLSSKTHLKQMLDRGALTGTLLFLGSDEAQKYQTVLEIAKSLFGPNSVEKIDKDNHPDLHILKPEGKSGMHSIAAVQGLIQEMQLPPYEQSSGEASCKIFVICDAERMLPAASNALLKTLEEPNLDALLILLSSEPQLLLPTLLSRCRILRFDSLPTFAPSVKLVEILSEEKDHPSLLKALDELEGSLSGEEDAESSPERAKHLDLLYEHILCWYRDRHLLALAGPLEHLFYKDHLSALQKAEQLALPSLEKIFSLLEECRLASQRYIRLRHILEYFFTHLTHTGGLLTV